MKTLWQYICEARSPYNIGKGFSKQDCHKQFRDVIDSDHIDTRILNGFIDLLYKIWDKYYNCEDTKIPFRFNGNGKVKLGRMYMFPGPLGEIESWVSKKFGNDYLIKSRGDHPHIRLNDLYIYFGNGSMFGDRASAGLNEEGVIQQNIIKLIDDVAQYMVSNGVKKINNKWNSSIYEHQDIAYLHPLFQSGTLNTIIYDYIADPSIDLSERIKLTGGGNTRRNTGGILWDSDFNIQTKDIEGTIKESGKIIADITIDGDTYISCKMKTGQLSGVNYSQAMGTNRFFHSAIADGKSYDEIAGNSEMTGFNNFCKALGISPKELYDKYMEKNNTGSISSPVLKPLKRSSHTIGLIFQYILGGNYWYIKDNICIYVPGDDAHLNFNISDISITTKPHKGSEPGKAITISGTINGVPASIAIRTSGSVYAYPYRIFPIINVEAFINSLK